MLRKLLVHTSNYTIGTLFVTLASFISFPIFTRIFTVDEYGILNLISTTLSLLIALSKLGIQHSIVRFYGEIKVGKLDFSLRQYYSTVFFGMASVGFLVMITWAIASQLISGSIWQDQPITELLSLTSILIVVRVMDSSLVNILQAEERSGLYSIYIIAKRYLGLALVLITVLYIARDLYGFYLATIVTEIIALVALRVFMVGPENYTPMAFSPTIFRAMLAFGIPMIGYEMAGIVLNIGDRYIIQVLMGSSALGLYSAAYNLCEYVQLILVSSMGLAVVPMYIRLWEEKGELETRKFLQQSLQYYFMVGMPIIAGLSAVGQELLVFLASEKYKDSAIIIPYLTAGMVVDGTVIMVGAGLYIHKQTKKIATLVAGSAVVNIALNLLLVPTIGLMGASVATLASYVLLALSMFSVSKRKMPISFPWRSVLRYGVMSLGMYFAVVQIDVQNELMNLVSKVVTGMLVYLSTVIIFDRRVRETLREKLV